MVVDLSVFRYIDMTFLISSQQRSLTVGPLHDPYKPTLCVEMYIHAL